MATARRVSFVVRGRVQGVAYRASARRAARDLGLRGWVRNRDDEAVEGECEGEHAVVEQFLAWCHIGPSAARVTDVTVVEMPATAGEHTFEIVE